MPIQRAKASISRRKSAAASPSSGGVSPRSSHEALAALETAGLLKLVVTPNVDGLHEAAGSRRVIEIHGDHQHLQSLACGVTSKALQKPSSPPMSAP